MRACFSGPIDRDWGSIGEPAWNRMYLYLLRSEDNELLYVGITWNIKSRWQQHRLKKDWWSEVATAEVHEFTGKDELSAVQEIRKIERRHIATLNPIKNISRPARGEPT